MKAQRAQRQNVCTFRLGEETLGIHSGAVREGLRHCELRSVPLAPDFIGGVVAYRGEMLTAVNLRAVLGLPSYGLSNSALVLQSEEGGEPFALLVDSLADVVLAEEQDWEPNPSTLGQQGAMFFAGAYKQERALLATLDEASLSPSCLMSKLTHDSTERI